MISLKHSIGEVEQRERLVEAARRTLESVINAVADGIVPSAPQPDRHREVLAPVSQAIRTAVSGEALDQAAGLFAAAAADIGVSIQDERAENSSHVRAILGTLAEAAQILDHSNQSQSQTIRSFAASLESTAAMSSLDGIRQQITTEVERLRGALEVMCEENRTHLARLESEMVLYREQLSHVEALVFVDEVSGLGNRRQAERYAAGTTATISGILIDLNRFESLTERFGNRVTDGLLRQFAQRLDGAKRPTDACFRWGFDQFLLLHSGPLSDAMRLAFQLGPRLRGRYSVRIDERDVQVEVGASLGVADCEPAEGLPHLIRKAEAAIQAQRTI